MESVKYKKQKVQEFLMGGKEYVALFVSTRRFLQVMKSAYVNKLTVEYEVDDSLLHVRKERGKWYFEDNAVAFISMDPEELLKFFKEDPPLNVSLHCQPFSDLPKKIDYKIQAIPRTHDWKIFLSKPLYLKHGTSLRIIPKEGRRQKYFGVFKEFPHIRLEDPAHISFDCSDELFRRLSRATHTTEILIREKNGKEKRFKHLKGPQYTMENPSGIWDEFATILSILKCIHKHRPEICNLYWKPDPADSSMSHVIRFKFPKYIQQLRVIVPRDIVQENTYINQLVILDDVGNDDMSIHHFLEPVKKITSFGIDPNTGAKEKYTFIPKKFNPMESWSWSYNGPTGRKHGGASEKMLMQMLETLLVQGNEVFIDGKPTFCLKK